jgi:multisubunit Na+/H+ antiporter MnhG subunit
MFGSVEALVLMVFFWVVSAWVFYMIIKAAVRNGILEAEARRVQIQERETRATALLAERREAEPNRRDV